MNKLTLSYINPPVDEKLSNNLHPNLFYSSKWVDVLVREYDYEFLEVKDTQSNDFLIVALIHQFGFSKLQGLPFCDYTIPSIKNAEILKKLLSGITNKFPDFPIELKMVLPSSVMPSDFGDTLRHTAYCHHVDTSATLETIEENMDNSFLRGLRKARSNELEASIEKDKEALSNFYSIYCKQRLSKFKKLPQPYTFFKKIWDNFIQQDNGFILQIQKDSTIIASTIILQHHHTLYYKFGCSLQEYLSERPNNLLFYRLFKYAQEQDYKQVDLGLSGVSKKYEGLVRFKEYMGGVASNIYSLRLAPRAYDNTAEKQLNEFTSSLTKTIIAQNPDEQAANAYSQILYPYFA